MYYDESGKTEDFVKDRMTDFLRSIPPDDVIQIAKTSTSGLIQATTVDEAIGVILRYSDAVTLLNRRKIKTTQLANYLHSRRVTFSLPATKTALSRKVLQYWGIDSKNYDFDEQETGDSSSQLPVRSANRQRHDSGVVTTYNNDQYTDSSIQYLPTVQLPSAESTAQTLAFQFASWFYPMLNNLTDLNSNHFWPNCTLHMEVIIQPQPIIREMYSGRSGEETCAMLKSLIVEHHIQFNPNTLNGTGIQGSISPHGLVEVTVCGSAHRANSDFGWFDQKFNLIRDPQFQNNFKISSTILIFRKGVNLMSSSSSTSTSGYITGS